MDLVLHPLFELDRKHSLDFRLSKGIWNLESSRLIFQTLSASLALATASDNHLTDSVFLSTPSLH